MIADKWYKISRTRMRYSERRNMPKYSTTRFLFQNKNIKADQG